MNSEIKKILNTIEKNGFETYVVGGFVRDYLLGHQSNDVDICTNAKPKDIQKIFGSSKRNGPYGTYNFQNGQYNFDITTYREEFDFIGRHPSRIEYTDNLLLDLKRRDFTINAICMNKEGKILDFLGGKKDIEQRQIKTIGDPEKRIQDDPLRILRAIRLSCTLHLQIETNLWHAMEKNKKDVLELSKERIKKEIDFILLSENYQKGLDDLEKLGILSALKIHFENVSFVNDLCGMWAQANVMGNLPFTKTEKRRIKMVQSMMKLPAIDVRALYEYGLEPALIVAKIKGYDEKKLTTLYEKMPIHHKNELSITFEQLQDFLKTTAMETKNVEKAVIAAILEGKVKNTREDVIKYCKSQRGEI